MAVTAEQALPLDVVKALHDRMTAFGNDLADLKTIVATKDDIAAINKRLDGVGGRLDSIIEKVELIIELVTDDAP